MHTHTESTHKQIAGGWCFGAEALSALNNTEAQV